MRPFVLHLALSVLVLPLVPVAAAQAVNSLPPIGALVRVIAPRLGPDWQVGMFNRLRVPSGCHRILLFTLVGARRIRAILEPSEVTRLQVAIGPNGQVQMDHPPAPGATAASDVPPSGAWLGARLLGIGGSP